MTLDKKRSHIFHNIIENMNDGVLTVDMKGLITHVNPAALKILELDKEDTFNNRYMEVFFEHAENDAFNQVILDAVYESSTNHNHIVNFFTGKINKSLFMTTSFLQIEQDGKQEKLGVIAVFSDVTELMELRDAVLAMEKIKELNKQLELRNQFISETFGRYLSDEIVSSLLEQPEKLELGGEKKQVSIMMTDLRGFTTMSEQLPPETVVTMLNNYLGKMVDVIYEYGGTVLEFIGDAIMVIFGAPIWCEDHANKCVACAISMQAAMDEVNKWNSDNGFPEIEMGIGINTGHVIVGNIGSEKRVKYGVVGRHVNLASRIESYTVGRQIIISPTTKEAINTQLEIENEMLVTPKGINEPITIYEIKGIGEPYNLYLDSSHLQLMKLPKELPISISLLEDKHCVGNFFTGSIKRISMREAEMSLSDYIPAMSTLKIQMLDSNEDEKVVADDIYAMLTSVEEGYPYNANIRFTWLSKEGKDLIKSFQRDI